MAEALEVLVEEPEEQRRVRRVGPAQHLAHAVDPVRAAPPNLGQQHARRVPRPRLPRDRPRYMLPADGLLPSPGGALRLVPRRSQVHPILPHGRNRR